MKAAFCFGVDQSSRMRVAAEPVSAAGEFAKRRWRQRPPEDAALGAACLGQN
jgi:hypothetical protein